MCANLAFPPRALPSDQSPFSIIPVCRRITRCIRRSPPKTFNLTNLRDARSIGTWQVLGLCAAEMLRARRASLPKKRRVQIWRPREKTISAHIHSHLLEIFSFSYSAPLRSGDARHAHILAGGGRAKERAPPSWAEEKSSSLGAHCMCVWVRARWSCAYSYTCMCGEKKATPPAARRSDLLQSLGKTPSRLENAADANSMHAEWGNCTVFRWYIEAMLGLLLEKRHKNYFCVNEKSIFQLYSKIQKMKSIDADLKVIKFRCYLVLGWKGNWWGWVDTFKYKCISPQIYICANKINTLKFLFHPLTFVAQSN